MAVEIDKADPSQLYEFEQVLGKGNYGVVYRVKDNDGRSVAMKVLQVDSTYTRAEIMNEVEVLQRVDSDFLVCYVAHYQKQNNIYIIMELCEAGSVSDLMHLCNIRLNEKAIRDVIASAVLALQALHVHNIIHRDVKSGNLLLTRFGQVKLGDFGVSAFLDDTDSKKRTSAIGTPYWMAPEVVMQRPYSFSADIWSLGITLIEIAEKRPPNATLDPMELLKKLPTRPPPKFDRLNKWSSEMKDFLDCCLKMRPSKRSSIPDLLDHDFISSNKDKLRNATPVGASKLMQALVKANQAQIDKCRRAAIEGSDESEEAGSQVGAISVSSEESSVDIGSNIQDFKSASNLLTRKKTKKNLIPKTGINRFSYEDKVESVMSSIAYKSFILDNKSPVADSQFFNAEKMGRNIRSLLISERGSLNSLAPVEEPSEREKILSKLADDLTEADTNYHIDIQEVRSKFREKRAKLINKMFWGFY